jgi:hypothetical protein
MTKSLIYEWAEADVCAVLREYGLDDSIIDDEFLEAVTEQVHVAMDKIYALDAFIEAVLEVATNERSDKSL